MHRAATLVHLPTCVIDLANRRLIRPDGEERLSGKEVAERMGRTENATHLLLSRALKRLAQELKL